MASSRVGTSTRPSGLRLSGRRPDRTRRWIIGNPNAAVFPVPVWARASRSAPLSTNGIDAAWMGVGSVYPMARRGIHSGGATPSFENDIEQSPELPGVLVATAGLESRTQVTQYSRRPAHE